MLRCITEDELTLISTTCDKNTTRDLSKKLKLFCPNCKNPVRYNAGKVKMPYFSHINLECNYIGYEKETQEHIKGKEILYSWLRDRYPNAIIEYEYYIAQTSQIADIYVQHREGHFNGLIWAFEFQHSKISSEKWAERHLLYESIGIQDFWIFDSNIFMKFSRSMLNPEARIRAELERVIFDTTGLVYFLDLKTSQLTIDFNFIEQVDTVEVNGVPRNNVFTYHEPREHSILLHKVETTTYRDYEYTLIIDGSLEEVMGERFEKIAGKLESRAREKRKVLFVECFNEKLHYAERSYEGNFSESFYYLLQDSAGEVYYDNYEVNYDIALGIDVDKELIIIKDDIIELNINDFFNKYELTIQNYSNNIGEYKDFKENSDPYIRLLSEFAYVWDFKKLGYLVEQGNRSLKEYLTEKYEIKLHIIKEVHENYSDVLEWLSSKSLSYIDRNLSNLSSTLRLYKKYDSLLEYATLFKRCDSMDEAEEIINQLRNKITELKTRYSNPLH